LVRGITPPGDKWVLAVPAGTRGKVVTALAPPPRRKAAVVKRGAAAARQEIHVVKPRETVSSIAKQHGVAVADILRWNRLKGQARIRPGDRLRIVDSRPSASEGQGGFR
jgi:membrane-bound lytic murein transglycosylase D